MMIRGLSYDDRRLRDLPGEPLLATMVESAARCCGMGLIYEFWGVYEGLRDRTPKGVILQKGHALWASAFCPEAAAEIVDFLQWRQEGWMMLCPTLAALWREKTGEAGLPLAVMELPVSPVQYEAAVVNLHLAERRRVGHTVTLERDGKAVSAAAVTDCGTRYGQISYVATLPEYEGQGYGRAVVYHCAGWLREKNLIPLVACETHRESFYAGLGFQKISEVTVFTG